jgi:hypothetical protein
MTGKLQSEAVTVSFLLGRRSLSVSNYGSEVYFTYFYAYAKASGKLPHARRTPHP